MYTVPDSEFNPLVFEIISFPFASKVLVDTNWLQNWFSANLSQCLNWIYQLITRLPNRWTVCENLDLDKILPHRCSVHLHNIIVPYNLQQSCYTKIMAGFVFGATQVSTMGHYMYSRFRIYFLEISQFELCLPGMSVNFENYFG